MQLTTHSIQLSSRLVMELIWFNIDVLDIIHGMVKKP